MRTPIRKPCPHCQHSFQPHRKNQLYCSAECRIDANNEHAKERYAHVKEATPKIATMRSELAKLKEYLASLTIVLKEVNEVDNRIRYAGRNYKRGLHIGRIELGVSLYPGGALLVPGNKIIYRTKISYSNDNYWEYTLDN